MDWRRPDARIALCYGMRLNGECRIRLDCMYQNVEKSSYEKTVFRNSSM